METVVRIGKGISYAHDKNEDKHYFGGFLNLAQNNIGQVFNEFCERLNIKNNGVYNIIEDCFKNNISYSDWEKRIEILKEYFPVIDYLDLPVSNERFEIYDVKEKEAKKREYFRVNFRNLIKTVGALRDFYTHYYHSPIQINDNLFDFLDSSLLKVCTTVKKKRMKTDKTRQILKNSIQTEWEHLEKLKKEELKKNKRADLNDKEGIRNAILNDAFHHLIYMDKGTGYLKDAYKTRPSGDYCAENKVSISKSGLVFLLSMFLTKKETEQLKSNIKGFKAKALGENTEVTKKHNSLKYMATHWVFSYLSYKGLKRRISTSYNELTLLTQMIDELSKVPDEVYQTFSESDKYEFLEDINEFVQESMGDDNTLQEATVVHPVIRKRYENKFNYFAIRFLDEFVNFPTLKFQVFAGFYEHDNRPKEIKGINFTSERVIKEKINVFGKLSEVAKNKSDYFKIEENQENWHLFPNPSYNFNGNNIHIYIDIYKKGDEARNIQIEINKLRNKLNPKKYRNKRRNKEEIINEIYKDKDVLYKEPTALLSLNELPSLLYEVLINKKTGAELEGIIVKKIIDRFNTVKNFSTRQQLSNSVITKRLKKSKSNDEYINTDKLLRAIDNEIIITNEKLELIKQNRKETEQNKPIRKYVFYTNELGQEATWLANDLKRFMPNSAKKQWKSNQHSELQRLLAFYDRHKNDAKNLLTINWDLNSAPTWGGDINLVFNKNNFDEFYEEYLISRKSTLTGFTETIKNQQNLPAKFQKKALNEIFIAFDKKLYTISSTQKQKEELLAKPLVFSRGIFDEKPTFIKGKKLKNLQSYLPIGIAIVIMKLMSFKNFMVLEGAIPICLRNIKKKTKSVKAIRKT